MRAIKSSAVTLTLVAWCLYQAASDSAWAQEKVRIGISGRSWGFLPTALAEKKGLFGKYGLSSEHVVIASSVATVALNNENLDFYMGVGPAISAILKGLPLKMTMLTSAKLHFLLLVKPEVQKVADLRGKTIGISRFGSTTHLTLRTILNHFGLVAGRDVKLLAAGDVNSQLAALERGQIDAAYHGSPLDIGGGRFGYKVLLWARDYLDQPMASLVVTDRKLKQSPDEVKRVMKGTIEALSLIRKEKEETVQFVSQWMKVDRETAAKLYENLTPIFSRDGTITEKAIREAVDDVLEQNQIKREVPVSMVADPSLLLQAQREMGLR
jgi:NitT/TauT family transport system substrate-binding protein